MSIGSVLTRAGARWGLLAAAMLAAPAAYAADDDVWALMKKPGHIVLLRHSNAPGDKAEPYGINLKDCSIQRSLDDEGRAQARRLGAEFRKHGIKNVRVVSSQFCRARETGKLLALGAVKELPVLNQVFLADVGKLRDTSAGATATMKKIPRGQLTVMVTHVSNIQGIAGVNLSSGELAVVHIDAAGAVAVDGRIMVK